MIDNCLINEYTITLDPNKDYSHLDKMENSTNTEVKSEEIPDKSPEKAKQEPDLLSFLKGLRLEQYCDIICRNGGERLNQLLYVDEITIDRLCVESRMKIIHAGVLKKALRECKTNSRMAIYEEKANMYRAESIGIRYGPPNPYMDYTNSLPTNRLIVNPAYADHPLTSQQYQLMNHNPNLPNRGVDNYYFFNRPMGQVVEPPLRPNMQYEDNLKQENGNVQMEYPQNFPMRPSPKSSDETNPPLDTLPDGSYYVMVGERAVKFPPSVRRLTHISRIDKDRWEIVKRGSQIYGRDDTKRKNNELTPLEVFMNDIAMEICLRDFTYMISRQKLLGLVREIVRDNQIPASGVNSQFVQPNIAANTNGFKQEKSAFSQPEEIAQENNFTSMVVPEQPKPLSDYEIILFYKMHKEWPPEVKKEQRKYLARRASNFDLFGNFLYYTKDNSRRKWLVGEKEIEIAFYNGHVDRDSGRHFSKEATQENICQKVYFKNMTKVISDHYNRCVTCQDRYAYTPTKPSKRNMNKSSENEEIHVVSLLPNEINPFIQNGDEILSLKRQISAENEIVVPPVKRPRKSIPRKLKPANTSISFLPSQDMELAKIGTDIQTYTNGHADEPKCEINSQETEKITNSQINSSTNNNSSEQNIEEIHVNSS